MGEKQKRTYDADEHLQHVLVVFRTTKWTFGDHEETPNEPTHIGGSCG
jgi:hypothetical protein